ncbi:MAG: hypothetical protein LQ340_007845, partial [Diploschistes diacapsis]
MNGGLIFLIILIFVIILPATAYVLYTRYRARSQGLPPPPLSAYNPISLFHSSNTPSSSYNATPSSHSSNPLTWIQDKVSSLRSGGRSSGTNRGISRSTRGFGPLDPDGAWDDRVGNEAEHLGGGGADYEEQELGLHPTAPGRYGGSGYGEG